MRKLSIGIGTGMVLLSGASSAQTTSLVSQNSSALLFGTDEPSISATGRFLAFSSTATNLIAGDANGVRDVFVHDRQAGSTTLVSRSSAGVQGNGASESPSITPDGRYVAFESEATNLVASDLNARKDVFVHDRQTGMTSLVSVSSTGVQGNNSSFDPSLSGDGRFVAFSSSASSFDLDDTTGSPDVYVRDLQANTLELASRSSAGVHGNMSHLDPSMSFDGRYLAFSSLSTNLAAGDMNGDWDVFLRDRQTGTTAIVSVTPGGVTGNGRSYSASISSDGWYVAFVSGATDLVPGDNPVNDVFVRDLQTGTTALVSRDSSGNQGNNHSSFPSISADGQHVAFEADASNLVGGDGNGVRDVFIRHLQSGTTELASRNSAGVVGDDFSSGLSISADGRFITFRSAADNLTPNAANGVTDLFVFDGAPMFRSFCLGDGTGASCPCGNSGTPGHGCENSGSTGGALLAVAGTASLSADTMVLTSSGERPVALSIVLQGSLEIGAVNYGDGLRCVGGTLKRLYVRNAVGGMITAPQGADPSISARSAAMGSVIPAGTSRYYQTYYRDGNGPFCPDPPGNTWNVTNAIEAVWGY